MRSVIPRQIVAILMLAFAFQSAWAIDIHSAKDQGLVGEANTGYLAAVGDSPHRDLAPLHAEKRLSLARLRCEMREAVLECGFARHVQRVMIDFGFFEKQQAVVEPAVHVHHLQVLLDQLNSG